MARHSSKGHMWEYDDRGGERSLPNGAETCASCGKTWSEFSAVPIDCRGRPTFSEKKHDHAKPEPIPAVSDSDHTHIGHVWPKNGGAMPKLGTPCKNCGVEYGNPAAVSTCAGSAKIAQPVADSPAPPELLAPSEVKKAVRVYATASMPDYEAWVRFAGAMASESIRGPEGDWVSKVAADADKLLEEFRKRFP